MESVFRSILKDASDLPYMIRLECPGTVKALIFYQYFSAAICNILHWITLEFETLHMGKSLLQRITLIIDKYSHGGDKSLMFGLFQCHQCEYLMKKSILQSTPQVYYLPRQVLNHILTCLRAFMKTLYMVFHVVQGKTILM